MGDLSEATGLMALIPEEIRGALDPVAALLAGTVNKTIDVAQAKTN
jgi:hypothetical protein